MTACSAVGLRVAGAPQQRMPTDASLDSLVVGAAATAVPAPPPLLPQAGADVPVVEAPETFTGEVALRPPPAKLHARPAGAQGGTWAVVIGINDYPGSRHDLRSAVSDAEEVSRALGALGVPAGNRLVVTDGQATAKVVNAAADWLVARAGPDAVAVFFFAGHVRKLSTRTEAMVGADGKLVTDAELARRLAPLKASRVWVGMAACYGGGFTEVLRPGVVLTGAAPANERAYENSAFNRSYMVEYMVRQAMVEGRASETVQAAYAYARDSLSRDFPNRVPVQFDHSDGGLDLRPPGFAPPPKRPPDSSPPPPPKESPPPPSGGGGGSPGAAPVPPNDEKCPLSTIYIKCDD